MDHLKTGFGLLLRHRDLWPYVWRPLGYAAFGYLAVLALGFALAAPAAADLAVAFGLAAWVGGTAGVVGFGVLWWFVSGPVFFALGSFFSSFLWERLSWEVEQRLGVASGPRDVPFGRQIVDSATRVPFSLAATVLSVLFFWLPAVPAAFGGWIGLYDFSSASFLRRGMPFHRQFAAAWRRPGALGFAAGCAVLSMAPLLNLLAMPALVAGGVSLAASDRR